MFASYKVRIDQAGRKNDGTTKTPYKERVVLGADGENQLVLCDMKGLKNVTRGGRRVFSIFNFSRDQTHRKAKRLGDAS